MQSLESRTFKDIDVPLFGFKVLAGGAIQPEDGFRYAFESGSDFICVGMFDFQVVENVIATIDQLVEVGVTELSGIVVLR